MQGEDYEKTAQEKIKEAERELEKKKLPLSLSSSANPQAAAKLYIDVGDIYYNQKLLVQAVEFYSKSIEILEKHNFKDSTEKIAQCYTKIGDLYSMGEYYCPDEIVKNYSNSALYHALDNNLALAAFHQLKVAEIYETVCKYDLAIIHLSIALNCYKTINIEHSYKETLIKYSLMLLKTKKYLQAAESFERLSSLMTNPFYTYIAVMCYYMCGDNYTYDDICSGISMESQIHEFNIFSNDETTKYFFENDWEDFLKLDILHDEIKVLIKDIIEKVNKETPNLIHPIFQDKAL